MQARIHDGLNLLSKLTFKRVLNAVLILSSYYFSRLTKMHRPWGKPLAIAFEPTTACNLGCPECPSGLKQFTRPTGNLKIDFFQSMLDELEPTTTYMTFYFQGEPFINPKFLEMVQKASAKKNIHNNLYQCPFLAR